MENLKLIKSPPKSKNPLVAFLTKAVKGVVGFFGVFIIFPVIIAVDCFKDNEWVWNKIEVE